MIVERVFHYPKVGCGRDLVKLFVENSRSLNPHVHAIRVYSSEVGCSAGVAMDLEFESYKERERFWADFAADPEYATLMGDVSKAFRGRCESLALQRLVTGVREVDSKTPR